MSLHSLPHPHGLSATIQSLKPSHPPAPFSRHNPRHGLSWPKPAYYLERRPTHVPRVAILGTCREPPFHYRYDRKRRLQHQYSFEKRQGDDMDYQGARWFYEKDERSHNWIRRAMSTARVHARTIRCSTEHHLFQHLYLHRR